MNLYDFKKSSLCHLGRRQRAEGEANGASLLLIGYRVGTLESDPGTSKRTFVGKTQLEKE